MKGRSCLQQLLVFINALIEGHESSTPMDTVYLDISKAFIQSPTRYKLWSLEIHGILWHWFN